MEKSLTTFLSLTICVFLSCSDSTEPENVIDEIPPAVVITSPAPNVTLNAPILIKTDATDNMRIDSVSFLIDGVRIGVDESMPYEQYWQVGYWADGYIHTIFAKAYDKAGNVGQSDLVSVTISKEAWFAPILINPLDGSIFRTENNVTLLWHSMPNGINYAILIADDPTFLVIKYMNMTSDTTLTKLNLTKGSHYWKVRAENTQGLWSDNSDYRLLVTGDFSKSEPGSQGLLRDRRIRTIAKRGDFKKVLKDLNPKLKISVPNKLSDDPEAQMDVELDISDMKDFHPDEIVKKVEPLQKLLEARERLKQLKLAVLKDVNLKKAIEGVLKEGGSSIEDLMGKLAPAEEKKEEKKDEKKEG